MPRSGRQSPAATKANSHPPGWHYACRMADVNADPVTLDWAQKHVCPQTVGGWLWYCNEHNTHGNAGSDDEARSLAAAHAVYFAHDEVGEICQLSVWARP